MDTDDLVARALVLDDDDEAQDDEYWAIVSELQRRGDPDTFEAARELCEEPSDKARCLGAAVLGQLGRAEGTPFLEQSLPLLLELCSDGASADVLAASLHALGSLEEPRALAAVLAQRLHADPTVRLAVAQALAPVAGDPPQADAIEAVMQLMRDEDADVRDWATFSLGSLLKIDTAAVRDALLGQLDDADEGVSAEALAGLAARGDARANDVLLRRLDAAISRPFDNPRVADLLLEAAEQLGDPRFLPALATLRARTESSHEP
jgi:HEAT repeat protein